MDIELKEKKVVAYERETHYKLLVKGQEVWVSDYVRDDDFCCEADREIMNLEEVKKHFSEEEINELENYIDELEA
jgi:hypothetical protein